MYLFLLTNFYEKALFVKPTWRPLCVVNATTLPFARYASIRTLSGSQSLFGGSVHRMRSVLSSQRRCHLLSGLSSLRLDQVRNRAVASLDQKRVRASSAVAIRHFRVAWPE